MEKENLDDLMREKFDTDDPGARFEFREEYWEQAQAMLEADERRRKRRRFLWWWLFAGCLLMGAGGWFWHGGNRKGGMAQTEQAASQPKTADGLNAQKNNQLDKKFGDENPSGKVENLTDGLLAGTPTTADGTPTTADGKAGEKSREAGGVAGAAHSPVHRQEKRPTASDDASTTASAAVRPSRSSPRTAANTSAAAQKSGKPRNPSETGLLTGGQEKQPNTSTGLPPTAPPSSAESAGRQMAGQTAPPSPNGSTAERVAETTTSSSSNPSAARQTPAGIAVLAPQKPLMVPDIQPLDFQLLMLPPNIPFFPKATPEERQIKPLREPRLSIGVGASASAFFPKNRAARWGSTAGIFADYRLSRAFSLNTGLAWRYVPVGGIVADSVYEPLVSQQLRYSFGYEQTRTSIRPQGLHTLEMPLALRWHWQAWHLEGGAALSRLLGVRADFVEQRSTSLQPLPEVSQRKIWVDTQPYRQTWLSPMAGAGWQRGRWSVSLRASLMPANVMPPQVPDEPRASGWRPNVEVSARWRIF